MCIVIIHATLELFTEMIIQVPACAITTTLCIVVLCASIIIIILVQPTTLCVSFIALEINIEEYFYNIREENTATNPVIRLEFRRTQSPFTMTIFPVRIENLDDRFNFTAERFINIPNIPEAIATSGEC